MGDSTPPIAFRDPFSTDQSIIERESDESPRPRAHTHVAAHTLYPGSTIFSAPGRALSVPRVERMRAAGKSIAKDTGGAGGYGIEMTALPPSVGGPTKEDAALAKWRKWVVEQPNVVASPLATRSKSVSSSFVPHAPVSAPMARGDRSGSGEASGSGSGSGSIDDAIHYNTASILALKDVELAVDESILANNPRSSSRFTSPRVSTSENPFLLIASRLSSRRVRPIILELIRSLGHYIYAVWTIEQPGPCPWIGDDDHPLARRTWRSHVLCAVDAARQEGVVPSPDLYQLTFWRTEVEYGLHDANAAVGIMKKQGWAFTRALRSGKYGSVEDTNVLSGAAAGNIVRMLNDLEEALWGEAYGLETDLAWEVDADFDMYARVVDEEPGAASASATRPPVQKPAPPPDTGFSDPFGGGGFVNGLASVLDTLETPILISERGRRETLEEIGKKRHAEWLARREKLAAVQEGKDTTVAA